MFSIVIPTWNSLGHLALCIASIEKHSRYDHEILVHVNEGSDGTVAWLKAQGIRYSHSPRNIGVCIAVNHLFGQASKEWVLYLNDDMVVCPHWDEAFVRAIETAPSPLAFYSGTMIESRASILPHVIAGHYGATPAEFSEEKLLAEYMQVPARDISGFASQPTLIRRELWHQAGGYSIEYGPGMSGDDDLLMKLWTMGCRTFKIIGASRFYHFSSRSTNRVRKNKGGRTFVMKWGITQQEFHENYLNLLQADSTFGALGDFPRPTLKGRLKRIGYGLSGNYPLGDLQAWDPMPLADKDVASR
ncbi:MAG: glycosyltransferase family 2 protein [Betaproteobacteria bacterium]|nr:glycosyltransferase family 2 protein [Betaproteobacteria bacterium]